VSEPKNGDVEDFYVCAGCKRPLLRSTVVGDPDRRPDGTVWTTKDWKMRPWVAVVPSRTVPPYGSEKGPPLHEMPLDGPQLVPRETPSVCSRSCLDTVRSTNPLSTFPGELSPNADIFRDGDDVLCRVLGSEGPMRDAPSDEWLDPPQRDPKTGERLR
jgi:hypothetical protein